MFPGLSRGEAVGIGGGSFWRRFVSMLLDEISNFPRVCIFSFSAKIRANDLASKIIHVYFRRVAPLICIYFSSISSGNGAFQSHPHPSIKSRDREIQRTYLPVTGSSRRYNERSCTVTYEKRVYTKRGGGYTWSISRLVDRENQATAQSPETRGIHARFFTLCVSQSFNSILARSSSSTHRESKIF